MKPLVSMDPFDCPPQCVEVNGKLVYYLSFSRPKTAHKSPVVILSGVFQTFQSFKRDVENLSDTHPILLVDLPGQGDNDDLGEGIDFEGLADLLCGLINIMGIERITPITFSHSSMIGFFFASKYPARTQKLIMVGATSKVRKSVRLLLEQSMTYLKEGNLENFSASTVLNLFNFYHRHKIKGAEILHSFFFQNILRLRYANLTRYRLNTKRILDLDELPKAPVCETLVLVGEYDNFTTPAENFSLAKKCLKSTLGIIKNTDHLASYENKKLINKIYKKFLAGVPINETYGVSVFKKDEYPIQIQRLEPRHEVNDDSFIESADQFYPVKVINISTTGVMLDISLSTNIPLNDHGLKLHLPFSELNLDIFLVDRDQTKVRGIFKKCSFEKANELEKLLAENVAAQSSDVRIAS